jgi:outer membrane murein-binding lipoprotein Lpp
MQRTPIHSIDLPPARRMHRHVKLRVVVVLLSCVVASSLLGGCDRQLQNTRNEVWQLAFRTSQLQAALERCEADEDKLAAHSKSWDAVFDEAAEWLDIDRDTIANRQDEGRKGLTEDAEVACALVNDALGTSLRTAKRWTRRVERQELCGWLSCE